ncbi:unnamed protein product, partial [Iphiclides podalirius]
MPKRLEKAERDQIDTGAQRIINTCSHLLKEFRNDNRKLSVSQQMREYMDAVIDLIDAYLKAVCKIHSELKALRVKRALDIRKLSRLEPPQAKSIIVNPFISEKSFDSDEEDEIETESSQIEESDLPKTKMSLSESEVAVMSDEGELSAEELQMFESENIQLLNELNSMTEEVKQIESKVLHIAELQEIFTEKILQQEQDIDRISNTVVGATENVKDANEQIKQAIQRNAGLRVRLWFIHNVMMLPAKEPLYDLGYVFVRGQLKRAGGNRNEPFHYNISPDPEECRIHYEKVGAAVEFYVYHMLYCCLEMESLSVPKDPAVSKNWVSCLAPLDAPIKTPDFDITRVSAGYARHEMNFSTCLNSVFDFFEEKRQ